MLVKVALVIYFYIFGAVLANAPPELGPTENLTEDQFNNFQGNTDPCDSTDTEFLKKVCNKVAVEVGQIKSGSSLKFDDNSPKCRGAKLQLQTKNGSTSMQSMLLYCDSKEADFLVGRGKSTNGVYGWSAEDDVCYPAGDVPNIFKCKDTVA